jgi:hypothetical protein
MTAATASAIAVQLGALLDGCHDGLVDRFGQTKLHLGLGENVRSKDLARLLARIEADCRRHIRLDVVDRLQTYCISAQFSSDRFEHAASDLLDLTGPH